MMMQPQQGLMPQHLEGQSGFSQQQVFPQGSMTGQMVPGQGGSYVYTRRIIDPNSNSVVAEERIEEH